MNCTIGQSVRNVFNNRTDDFENLQTCLKQINSSEFQIHNNRTYISNALEPYSHMIYNERKYSNLTTHAENPYISVNLKLLAWLRHALYKPHLLIFIYFLCICQVYSIFFFSIRFYFFVFTFAFTGFSIQNKIIIYTIQLYITFVVMCRQNRTHSKWRIISKFQMLKLSIYCTYNPLLM